jgi:hypothetical protein
LSLHIETSVPGNSKKILWLKCKSGRLAFFINFKLIFSKLGVETSKKVTMGLIADRAAEESLS